MKRALLAILLLILASAAAVEAQQVTKPVKTTWIVTSCDTWDCAMSALVLANGDKYTMVLPTSREATPWLVLRRVEEGSVYIPDGEPFGCEVFENVPTVTTAYTAMNNCHAPMMLTVPDGKSVLISLHQCDSTTTRRRAVR